MGFLTKTCPRCHGSGEVHDGWKWKKCPTCKGKGVV